MRVTIKLYGNLKKYMPEKREIAEMELPPGATVRVLLMRLGVPDRDVWMSAVNDTVVPDSTELEAGDVVEVFEPVGGGEGKAKGKRKKEKVKSRKLKVKS